MEIELKKVSTDIIKEHNTLKEHLSCHNMDIAIVSNNNIELGYAIVTPKNNYDIDEVFEKNFQCLLEYSKIEYKKLYSEFKNILTTSSYLNYIEIYNKYNGVGTYLLNYLKNTYKNIWLYSVIESEEFWIKNSFVEISSGDYVYLYTSKNSNIQ